MQLLRNGGVAFALGSAASKAFLCREGWGLAVLEGPCTSALEFVPLWWGGFEEESRV